MYPRVQGGHTTDFALGAENDVPRDTKNKRNAKKLRSIR